MSTTTDYSCSTCDATISRPFRVRFLKSKCDDHGGFTRFIRTDLREKIQSTPSNNRPAHWDALSFYEQLAHAVKSGVVQKADLI